MTFHGWFCDVLCFLCLQMYKNLKDKLAEYHRLVDQSTETTHGPLTATQNCTTDMYLLWIMLVKMMFVGGV